MSGIAVGRAALRWVFYDTRGGAVPSEATKRGGVNRPNVPWKERMRLRAERLIGNVSRPDGDRATVSGLVSAPPCLSQCFGRI